MAHHIYHTEGIVLKNRPSGEANASIALFTRELGLIETQAQGLRLGKSKLRYSLQEFSVGNFEVVRGKHVWRVTNAIGTFNVHTALQNRRPLLLAVSRIFALLTRLLSGEEANTELFETTMSLVNFARDAEFSDDEIQALEHVAVWRILVLLGYGKEVKELAQFKGNEWTKEVLTAMATVLPVARREINKALKETQL